MTPLTFKRFEFKDIADLYPIYTKYREKLEPQHTGQVINNLNYDLIFDMVQQNVLDGIIAYRDNNIAGVFLFVITPSFYDKDIRLATEALWFCNPYNGGRKNIIPLYQEVERLAKERGCNIIQTSVHLGIDVDKELTTLGFKQLQISYDKRI